eukprot:TRINITY_DN497_c0_g1_i1.p1 TRINITY_DN497_c0_g1~~TRINITY_DN497_c0_g1_i1.p1  ORF type:complete len:592 (+),score=185.28 TRINITY_DN497_c0_g1_i1:67-1776(+)
MNSCCIGCKSRFDNDTHKAFAQRCGDIICGKCVFQLNSQAIGPYECPSCNQIVQWRQNKRNKDLEEMVVEEKPTKKKHKKKRPKKKKMQNETASSKKLFFSLRTSDTNASESERIHRNVHKKEQNANLKPVNNRLDRLCSLDDDQEAVHCSFCRKRNFDSVAELELHTKRFHAKQLLSQQQSKPLDEDVNIGMGRKTSRNGHKGIRQPRNGGFNDSFQEFSSISEEKTTTTTTSSSLSSSSWSSSSSSSSSSLFKNTRPQLFGGKKTPVQQFQGLINKITPENFDRITAQILALELSSSFNVMNQVIMMILKKAQLDHTYCKLYAGLLCVLFQKLQPVHHPETDELITPRKMMLQECQQQFENPHSTDSVEGFHQMTAEDQFVEEQKVKKRNNGHMKFIAELFAVQILSVHVVTSCIDSLMHNVAECIETGNQSKGLTANIECLVTLIAACGSDLETVNNSVLNSVFKQLQSWVDDERTPFSTRERFALMDLLDLRSNGWNQRQQDDEPQVMAVFEAAKQKLERPKKIRGHRPSRATCAKSDKMEQHQQQEEEEKDCCCDMDCKMRMRK